MKIELKVDLVLKWLHAMRHLRPNRLPINILQKQCVTKLKIEGDVMQPDIHIEAFSGQQSFSFSAKDRILFSCEGDLNP